MQNNLNYGGFWKRFGAYWVDLLFLIPVGFISVVISYYVAYGQLIVLIPMTAFSFWYHVYLVAKYGGTPGKLAMKLRVRNLDGSPVNLKTAFIRNSVVFVLSIISSIASAVAALNIDSITYASMSFLEKSKYLSENMPFWGSYSNTLINIWIWSEFLVLLFNDKRRALHDFMAGTVVVVESDKVAIPNASITPSALPEP